MPVTGGEIAKLWVFIGAQTDQFMTGLKSVANEMKKTEKQFSSFNAIGDRFQKIGQTLTLGLTLPLVALGGAAVKMGADVQESENLFAVSMGNMAQAATTWSQGLRDQLGLNEYEVRKNVSTFNVMFDSMGLGTQASFEMSKGLTQLSYDMASFYNLRPDEAFQKLQAGISGEVEPLKRLGIVVNETTVATYAYTHGIAAQGEKLSEQQKLLARYGVIMEATKKAQGDLERTGDSTTNQWRKMQQQLAMLTASFGKEILPTIQKVITGALMPLVERLKGAVTWFSKLDAGTKENIIRAVALVAAIGPLALGISGVIKVATSLMTTWGNLSKVAGALSKAIGIGTGSLAIWVIGIGLAIAAGVALYKNWDTVKRYALDAWGAIKSNVNSAIAAIIDAYSRFVGVFNAREAERLRGMADNFRQQAEQEIATIDERDAAAADLAARGEYYAQRRAAEEQQAAQETANAQSSYTWQASQEEIDAAKASTDAAGDAKDKKIEYLDEFQTTWERMVDKTTTDYERSLDDQIKEQEAAQDEELAKMEAAQKETLTGHKRMLEDKLDDFKSELQREEIEHNYSQEKRLTDFRYGLDQEIKAIEQRYNREAQLANQAYSDQEKAIKDQIDAIHAQEKAEQDAKRLSSLQDNITKARADLAGARTPEEVTRAMERLNGALADLEEEQTKRKREEEIARLNASLESLRAESDAKRTQRELDRQTEIENAKNDQERRLADFQQKLKLEDAQWQAEQGKRLTQREQEIEDDIRHFENKQKEALSWQQQIFEDQRAGWQRERQDLLNQYQQDLEDYHIFLQGKVDLQKAYQHDPDSLAATAYEIQNKVGQLSSYSTKSLNDPSRYSESDKSAINEVAYLKSLQESGNAGQKSWASQEIGQWYSKLAAEVAGALKNTTADMAAKWSKYIRGTPGLDAGGRVLSSGRVLVGERKPELLDLPTGATVTPLAKLAGGYGTANLVLEMDGRRLATVLGIHLTDLIRLKAGIK